MIFIENSRFCFCVEFELEKYKEFNEIIYNEFSNIHNNYKLPKDTTKRLNLKNKKFIFPIIYTFDIQSASLEDINFIDEPEDEIIKKEKESKKKYFEIPKAYLRIEFRIKKEIDNLNILEIFNNYPEKPLIKKIEKILNQNDFNIISCVYANFNKNAKIFQGIKLRQLLEFPGEINEKIGNPYTKLIGFDVKKSPLGIKELEFGEEEDKKIFNMRMKFKTKVISDLKDIFQTIIGILKLFTLEEYK